MATPEVYLIPPPKLCDTLEMAQGLPGSVMRADLEKLIDAAIKIVHDAPPKFLPKVRHPRCRRFWLSNLCHHVRESYTLNDRFNKY